MSDAARAGGRAPVCKAAREEEPRGAMLARLRIGLTYLWRHRRLPRLDAPRLFTEWVQHRKLYDRDRRLPRLADKLLVKALVAERIGPDWITPTWWSGDALPAAAPWPLPFVVKSRHGCKQIAFVRRAEDWPAARRRAARWMTRRYGWWLDEWLYGLIPRGLLVEPFIGGGGALPLDYKFYVFGGRVAYVQVHADREHRHRWMVVDREWRAAAGCAAGWHPPRPAGFDAMIAAAETLGGGFDFVRVDLYDLAGHPRFGEISFYPGSGLDPFDPPVLDAIMGALWRDAVTRRCGSRSA